ncbi:MAG: hypothetical protein KDD40_07490, partial [Bdellovibrionales bacterium]|nr:hypothetical protein [Bdellovibrionales bacterium]
MSVNWAYFLHNFDLMVPSHFLLPVKRVWLVLLLSIFSFFENTPKSIAAKSIFVSQQTSCLVALTAIKNFKVDGKSQRQMTEEALS